MGFVCFLYLLLREFHRRTYLRNASFGFPYNFLYVPVHFLQESGKGFFIKKDGFALALRDDLKEVIRLPEFAIQMKDVIEYRTMDYYQRRYRAGKSDI